MKKLILALSSALVLMNSCNQTSEQKETTTADSTMVENSSTGEDVPFTQAENYFVNNTVGEDKNGTFKIESQEAFDQLFSGAATMAENGIPTTIDFGKQFVIAIISPTSDLKPSLDSVSLKKIGDDLVLDYKETMGEKQSYSIRPTAILIVDKQYNGNLKADMKSSL